jgi:TDG/mug DNA glycosylase family protein
MSDQPVPDIIASHLNILFCGINPGLMSAASHHNFARPGNRFWKALHQSGLTSRLLLPAEQEKLLEEGMGITNFVTRASATAQELSVQEIRRSKN